ncbi:MAG TPA: methyl-accepting chemotaxis protein [Anaerovoracaceae bacterium]|nr:methyl-accepting chemotaxis protein [Anaerovoracaceae bacterium]
MDLKIGARVLAGIRAVLSGILSSRSIAKQAEEAAGPADNMTDNMTDNMAESIMEAAAAIDKITAGDLDFQLKLRPGGDSLGISIRSLTDTLKKLAEEMDALTAAVSDGDLKRRGNAAEFSGVYKRMIENFNRAAGAMAEPVNTSTGSIRALREETETLSLQIMQGNLSARGVAETHAGDFAEVVKCLNRTLDSVIEPLRAVASHIGQIGSGEIPGKITKEYKGEFNDLKNSVNSCIDGLDALLEGRDVMYRMSLNDYSVKMEGAYLGIFEEIKKSVNLINARMNRLIATLTNVSTGDLSELQDIVENGKRSENDMLVPTLIDMIDSLRSLVDETQMIARAAVEGDLSVRGQEARFKGQYAKVIEGINETLDAITAPIEEASSVLREMAKGNLQAAMQGDYRGDHAAIKHALNETTENLRSYISEISNVVAEISAGNLDLTITADYKGDFVAIKDSLNYIIRSLSQVMTDFESAAEQVSFGSRQVSEGSQTLAQSSTEQAGSIQELTAAIGGIAEQIKDNAAKANEVYALARGARDGGAKGNQAMNEMLQSMEKINESSKNISRIIKVIDDIAFQTNILALNAAVEAARAGGHGKGFAVVAEEVRNLAARSAKAAEETTELIKGSIQKAQAGTKITYEIAGLLKEIADGAVISTEKLSIIAKASKDQASEIDRINRGIEQISRAVQCNSAAAEQSAAVSEELSGQAELLKGMVSKFKVGEEYDE